MNPISETGLRPETLPWELGSRYKSVREFGAVLESLSLLAQLLSLPLTGERFAIAKCSQA